MDREGIRAAAATRESRETVLRAVHSFCEFMLLPFAVLRLYELYLLMQLGCTSIWFIDNFKLLNVKSLSFVHIIELRCIGRCLTANSFQHNKSLSLCFAGLKLCVNTQWAFVRAAAALALFFLHSGMKFTYFCVHVFSSDECDVGKLHKCRSTHRHWVCMLLLWTMRRIVSHFSIVWNFHWRVTSWSVNIHCVDVENPLMKSLPCETNKSTLIFINYFPQPFTCCSWALPMKEWKGW